MKILYTICLLLIGFAKPCSTSAQDINFSQFYEMPLLRNPALAGIFTGDVRLTSAFRNQWQSVTVPYQTMALGAEIRFASQGDNDVYKTLGLLVTNDVAGDSKLKKIQVMPVFNLHMPINEDKNSFLSAAIMGGPTHQRFDPTNLYFDDQFVNGSYSPTNPTRQIFTNTNLTYWDVNAGLTYNSDVGYAGRYYVGVGIFHVATPTVAFMKQNDIKLNRKYVVNFGFSSPTSDQDKFTFYGDYFYQGGNALFQGGFSLSHSFEEDVEMDLRKGITGGIFYRWNDAIVPVLKLDLQQLSIGVSYDINVSKLKTASQIRGGAEVTLSYKNFLNIRNNSSEKVRCPRL